MSRAVLVGCSHGTSSVQGRADVRALLGAVRRRLAAHEVREAFVDVQDPRVGQVVGRLAPRPTVIVPLLLTVGHHVLADIGRAAVSRPGVVAAPALGPDPRLVGVLQDRVLALRPGPSDRVVIAVAGSGHPRAEHASRTLERQVRAGLERHVGGVGVGFIAAQRPTLHEAIAAARTAAAGKGGRVLVGTYLLAHGYFSDKVGQAAADALTPPLLDAAGPVDPRLVDLVTERFSRAAQDLPARG